MSRLRKKRGRKSNYLKSLTGEHWETVKRKVRLRDNFSCQICAHKLNLETHHITYFVDGVDVKGKELSYLQWMILLCENCHDKVHKDKKHPLNPSNRLKKNYFEFKEFMTTFKHRLISYKTQ